MERRKLVNGHYRTLLLKFFMDQKISIPTQEKMLEPFLDCPEEEKEQLAKDILDVIQDCETEEEMLQNLRRLFLNMRQPVNGHYRVLVLKWYRDMNLSESVRHRISKAIGDCDKSEREQMAKIILELTDDCKTEEEVLQKLKDIIK